MGKYHILKEYANGVMDEKGKFFPFNIANDVSVLTASLRHRIYIKSVQVTAVQTGAHAATDFYLTGIIEKNIQKLVWMKLPVTDATVPNVGFSLDVSIKLLLDKSSAITIAGDMTAYQYNIKYAAIDEQDGEYDG